MNIFSIVKKAFYGKKYMQPLFRKLYTISLGGMNYGNLIVDSSGEIFFLNYIYEKESSVTIFDVGANIGGYTLECKEVFKDGVEVHLFEPSPVAFEKAKETLSSNDGIVFNNEGLGSRQQANLTLNCHNIGGSGSSLFKRDLPNSEYEYDKEENVVINTLENYCDQNGIKEITLLKIDVEGYELEVLKGSGKYISDGKIKYIQFEFGDSAISASYHFKDLFEILSGKYNIFRLLQDGLEPYDRYDIKMEVFITTNYVAIRKDVR